jgi:lipopolysaccharide transport system ATP-binding protein
VGAMGSILKSPFGNLKRLKNLTSFNEEINGADDIIWALKDVFFEVKRGEVLGIIGANGAGKSTLLKILAQITHPTFGKVKLVGRIASLLEVGTGFHPELTGRENIYLNGTILGMTKKEIDSKLDEIIDFSGVEKFIDTPVKRYSSGMGVRLAFSVAAHLDPEILLIDEVLAVGDAEFQKKCLGKIDKVAKDGRTVIFISHNMNAVENLCENTIVLVNGELVKLAASKDAVEYYLSTQNKSISGEISWEKNQKAPGDNRVRLKTVRILSNGNICSDPICDEDIELQVEYWNFEANKRRLVSIHLLNDIDQMVFSSSNLSSSSLTYDKWCYQGYPIGLFRTKCIIPKNLLNPGIHSISLFINIVGSSDHLILEKKIISFEVKESFRYRTEYFGKWYGVIRPLLAWNTTQLDK